MRFSDTLGVDMSSAVNIFLQQCVLRGGLAFSVEIPQDTSQVLSAVEEAKQIFRDYNVPGCTDMKVLNEALEK